MLDVKYVLANLDKVIEGLRFRNAKVDFDKLRELSTERREKCQRYDQLRFEQRQASDQMRSLSKEEAVELRNQLKAMSSELKALDARRSEIDEELARMMLYIPNIPDPEVPQAPDEESNREIRRWGTPKTFAFEPKDHADLGEAHKILDFERGTKVSGARFTFLKGDAVRLELALIQFMLDCHAERGYELVIPPYIVNRASMTGTGQLPKFEEDAYKTNEDMFLIPTAEVPVTNLHRDELLTPDQLPIKYAAYSACFRLEAGSYGRDTRGIIRQHQFDKVELVKFATPETSEAEHQSLVNDAEEILKRLELPYRVMLLSAGDMGFSAQKCYDLEVWLPSQNCYREISSCSNFGDFQARRANIRYRTPEGKEKTAFVHTLNGSGLAVGRTLVAILENYQQEDGRIRVPEALKPYLKRDFIG
ncbi:MAG: serine--tRNA ligase [Proteobacteria bacterium]|jgi:seryl-tRNA synthetase|nr:serine--tRNA ligase [Pseudomonadota bacterium]